MASVLNRYTTEAIVTSAASSTFSAKALSSGTGRKFIIAIAIGSGTRETTGVTYDGESCTLITRLAGDGPRNHDWYYYDIPDGKSAANYDWVVSYSDTTSTGVNVAAWVTQNDTPGLPTYATATQPAGTSTISATIDANNGDVLLTAAVGTSTSGTAWNNCSAAELGVWNWSAAGGGSGMRYGRGDNVGDATESVTVEWTYNVTTNALSMVVVNSTNVVASGPAFRPYYITG